MTLRCAGAAVLGFVCLGGLGASAAHAASSRPDRELYQKAEQARASLEAKPKSKRLDWERVISRYRQIVARYPQSGYCDNSLFAIGELYGTMADRFKDARYRRDAAESYRAIVSEYPSSSLGEQALYNAFEMAKIGGSHAELADTAREYLEVFPDGRRASMVKASLRRSAPEKARTLPTPPPPGLAQIFSLRFWSGEASTRVVLEMEREVKIRHERISSPDRLYIDLEGTRLHPNLANPLFPVGDGLLEAIRIGQNRAKVVRVVLDFKSVKDHTVFYLQDPPRLVIDVRGTNEGREAKAPLVAAATPPPSAPEATAVRPTAAPTAPVLVAENETPAPTPRSSKKPRPTETPQEAVQTADTREPEPTERPAPTAVVAQGPLPNRATSSYSIARQLGLGARRIVIDAGHGGHDPGTIGRHGLQEKDLVLDVALRLEKLVKKELDAEVLMTRGTDVFIPLEERTAIANSKGADLFLSIHANSSPSPKAAGIETYFLSFAADRHAEEVAARENAISAATLKDLQGLVKAIALNSKIDESREFATCVQEAMFENLRPGNSRISNRGVRAAPFYVLIGANMPSVLSEIAFVSHPEEEKLLKQGDYREKIARSLLSGVRAYFESLNRAPKSQLTALSERSTVGSSPRLLPPVSTTRTRRSR